MWLIFNELIGALVIATCGISLATMDALLLPTKVKYYASLVLIAGFCWWGIGAIRGTEKPSYLDDQFIVWVIKAPLGQQRG